MSFEGFDGQTAEQPSKKQFWSRLGVDEQAAPGNGSLPPGAKETDGFPAPHFKSKPLPKTFA